MSALRLGRRAHGWMLPVLLVGLLGGGCSSKPRTARITQQDASLTDAEWALNLESFEYVWSTIRDKHWDPDLGGLDWQAVHDELRPEIEQASTMREARGVMRDMISRLEQSHFQIISRTVYQDAKGAGGESRDGRTGMDVRVVENRALVVSVDDGSPAAAAGVRPGWEVLKVGDVEIRPRLEAVWEEFEGRTYADHVLVRVVRTRLRGAIGEEIEVRMLDGRDAEVEFSLTLVKAKGEKASLGNLPPSWVWFDSRRLEDNIGYIAFNMFLDPTRIMGSYNRAMTEYLDCRGIIIDLRGNPGGIGPMAMGMAGWFVSEKGRRLGTMTTRTSEIKFMVLPRAQTYDGPVAVLIDGLSASTAEIMAGGLKDLHRARLFGMPTAGAALPSTIERLPNRDGFQYAIATYVSAGGAALEGAGVTPHVEVIPQRAALLAGRDPALDAAVTWIRQSE